MGVLSSPFFKMTNRRVDWAIKHTDLRIVNNNHYCYFVNKNGNWTGDIFPSSIMNEYGIKEWIELAEQIVDRIKNDHKKNKQSYKKV